MCCVCVECARGAVETIAIASSSSDAHTLTNTQIRNDNAARAQQRPLERPRGDSLAIGQHSGNSEQQHSHRVPQHSQSGSKAEKRGLSQIIFNRVWGLDQRRTSTRNTTEIIAHTRTQTGISNLQNRARAHRIASNNIHTRATFFDWSAATAAATHQPQDVRQEGAQVLDDQL